MKNIMTPDESYSLLVVALLLVTITQKQFSNMLMELLLKLTRPGATVFMLGLLLVLYVKDFHYTFLALAMLSVFLLRDIWGRWLTSDARRLYMDVGRDQDRFDHTSSIDLQMADKTVTHATPPMFHTRPDDLLVYPPSPQTLLEMNG